MNEKNYSLTHVMHGKTIENNFKKKILLILVYIKYLFMVV